MLLVDGDDAARSELAAALTKHFDVYEAADGASAVRLAKAILPSLVISEVELPVLSGLVMARILKSHCGKLKQVPIVFFSAQSAPQEISKAICAGARRYIMKPCAPKTICDLALRIVDF